MSAPFQHRGEPSWCVQTDHRGVGRHVSEPVRVGEQQQRGQVSARLIKAGHGPVWVVVNVAHMASASVDISLEDARKLRDGLTALLRAAGVER